jgi:hypothetical protein
MVISVVDGAGLISKFWNIIYFINGNENLGSLDRFCPKK